MDFEKEICDEILDIKEELPLPKASSPLSYHNNVKLSSEDVQLRLIHELLQGNIQRCSYSVQHLNEAKETMFQVELISICCFIDISSRILFHFFLLAL